MKYKVNTLTFLFISLFLSCTNPKEAAILGFWQAVEVKEEGKDLPVNASEISLDFKQNGGYIYKSTLNYKEKGSYYLKSDLLFTKDSLHKIINEKAVKIMKLNPDSLIIQMVEEDKERIVKFVKN